MIKTIFKTIVLTSLISTSTFTQNIEINQTAANTHPSAILNLNASPKNNTSFAMPRLTTVQRLAIVSPIDGLQVYDTNLKGFYYFNTTTNKWDCADNPAGTV